MLTHLRKAGEPRQGRAAPRALAQVGGTGRPLSVSIYQGLEATEGERRKLLILVTALTPPSAPWACGNVSPFMTPEPSRALGNRQQTLLNPPASLTKAHMLQGEKSSGGTHPLHMLLRAVEGSNGQAGKRTEE